MPFWEDGEIHEAISSVRGKLVDDLSQWSLKKATLGLIRSDLTKDLEKTQEGYPIVKAYNGKLPASIVEVGKIGKCKQPGAWLNGFSDDVILDRIWKRPCDYLNKIPLGGGIIAPDFSVKLHMSPKEKEYNIFRRNAIAAIAQKYDFPTIIPLTWAEYASFEYCCNGIEPEGIYAISNIGVMNDFISRKLFRVGLMEMVRLLNPLGFILYGYPMENTFGVPTTLYRNPHYALRKRKTVSLYEDFSSNQYRLRKS
ncbi:MAG: DUF4417 domain-containing protein [Muribaculaceae bacterium]|nr:DUF4417 domain-containing protein [Muribaculaceae bacterium]